jgi:hypothetical protein
VATKKQEILELSSNQNFRLIAVSSSLNLNKLIWSINAACSIKLVKNTDLESTLKLPVFTDRISNTQIIISLIPNKLLDIKLIKQLPNIDFIIEINGIMTDHNFKSFIQSIKKVEGVLAAIEINPSTIKRKEPFCPE